MQKIFYVVFVFTIGLMSAQAQTNLLAQGDKFMTRFQFDKAAAIYKKAADRDSKDIVAWEKLGNALMFMGDLQSAEAVYSTIITNPSANVVNKFYYAQVLRSNGKYTEAGKYYAEFAKAAPDDARNRYFLNFDETVQALQKNTRQYDLSNLPENSAGSDIGPAYCAGRVTFTSNRDASAAVKNLDFWSGKGFYDLYESKSDAKGNVSMPAKMKGKVNRKWNDGPATFSADGNTMIFTRSNKKKGSDGVRRLGLYQATFDAKKGWINVRSIAINSNNFNNAQPSLSADGNKLYFASDMPGGMGETDLYVSLKAGNDWTQPINLGKEINTPGKDMFPFIAADGTLFFSSDCRSGLGGLDIYSAQSYNNRWLNIQNLGGSVNSLADDFGYVAEETGKNGFLVSNRTGGLGDDDIYAFIKKTESVCGTIVDAKTKNTIEDVILKATGTDKSEFGIKSNMKGDFCLQLTPNAEYKIEAQKEGYESFEGSLKVKPSKNERVVIALNPRGGIELVVDVNQTGDSTSKIAGATAFLIDKQTGEVFEQKTDEKGIVKFDMFKDREYDLKIVKPTGEEGLYDKFIKTISTVGLSTPQTTE
jgi:tetratricopeptide (TPR) repeat protein